MDATNLIPGGFHPRLLDKTFDFKRQIKPLKRSSLKEPVRYYFIDFGLSSWFRKVDSDDSEATVNGPADKSLRRLVKGNKCQDPHISELNSSRPYDPFLLDIGILGNVFKRAFVNVRPIFSGFNLSRVSTLTEIFESGISDSRGQPNVTSLA